jgi:deazaflavin-dependent oxidoreductase (nitroreductase family)
MPDRTDWENMLIADMRAHGGAVTSGPLAGHPLLVMENRGARTGQPRRAILTYSRDGGDYVVAGSAGGRPTDPAWIRNVAVNPEVRVETGNEVFDARATPIEGAERDRLWDAHVAALPHFGEYPKKAGRTIPMVRLTPKGPRRPVSAG